MRTLRAVLVAALGATVPAIALAQPTGAGQEVELDEDPPPDMDGTAENPNAPRLIDAESPPLEEDAPPPVRTGYPIEEVLRPITLPAVTSEVGLDLKTRFSPVDAEIGLAARYGVTRRWQVGARYLVGGIYEEGDRSGFHTGKAFAVDVSYLVFDWLAASLTLPFYVDPFAMGVTLGAPMKFRFGDTFAIVALDDILDIRVAKFIPDLTSQSANAVLVESYRTNTLRSRANLHLRVGAIVQMSPELAIRGNLSQSYINFDKDRDPTGLEVLGQYSLRPEMDLIGRLGFDDLAAASSTFGLLLAVQYRI
jgi:hypothetical protein